MKIAVSSRGPTINDPVDPRFGRASKFVVFDTATSESSSVDNTQNLNAMQGAGIQSAQTVADIGASYVITGHCGPKAFRALDAAGVKIVIGAQGTVSEAIDKFMAGELVATDAPDVEGHWV